MFTILNFFSGTSIHEREKQSILSPAGNLGEDHFHWPGHDPAAGHPDHLVVTG